MSTCRTVLELCVSGHACERDVTLHYEFSPASGDGWHEPRYPAGATLVAAEVEHLKQTTSGLVIAQIDVMPLLTKECIENIEAELAQSHLDAMQPDPDLLRDFARDRP